MNRKQPSVRIDPSGLDYVVVKELHRLHADNSKRVGVIVPCFNEEAALPHLAEVLRSMRQKCVSIEWDFIFVNDASTDGTQEMLLQLFGDWPNCAVLRHAENQGITAAILTGGRYADTDIVCSIDSDCTYDPHELGHMVPLLVEGVDLVTSSPYHPRGRVDGVPAWRLWLSKSLSLLYRTLLRLDVYTYTSCFRAYRREAFLRTNVTQKGYAGLAESLLLMILAGRGVAEHPCTLHVRSAGHSKMKIVRTMTLHLKLLARVLGLRYLRRDGCLHRQTATPDRASAGPATIRRISRRTVGKS